MLKEYPFNFDWVKWTLLISEESLKAIKYWKIAFIYAKINQNLCLKFLAKLSILFPLKLDDFTTQTTTFNRERVYIGVYRVEVKCHNVANRTIVYTF